MKYENHIHTAAFSDAALDSFLETAVTTARRANASRKCEQRYIWQSHYSEVCGFNAAAHALCISCIIEMDEELEYFTSVRIHCGEYDKTVEV
jgi:hypothetical protein